MTYRVASVVCPACPGRTLHESAPGQLACEGCGGVLVSPEALVMLMLDAAPDTTFPHGVVGFPREYDAPRKPCPRCGTWMRACVLFAQPVDQCAEDGTWVQRDRLRALLEAARERYDARVPERDG